MGIFLILIFTVEHHNGTMKFDMSLSDSQHCCMPGKIMQLLLSMYIMVCVVILTYHFTLVNSKRLCEIGVRYYRGSNRDKRRRERNLQERLKKREGVQPV